MTVNVDSVVIKYETKEEIIKFIEKHPKETIDIFFPWYNKLLENPELFNKFYIEICSRNNSNSVMLIDKSTNKIFNI